MTAFSVNGASNAASPTFLSLVRPGDSLEALPRTLGHPAEVGATPWSSGSFVGTTPSAVNIQIAGWSSLIAFVTAVVSRRQRRGGTKLRSRSTTRAVQAPIVQETEDAISTPLPKVDRATTKAVRKSITNSDQYFRFSKTQMESAMKQLESSSGSDIMRKMRENGYRLTIGDITFVLAESYGFCWGVERTLAMAHEARNAFPDKSIWLTNEIIHNSVVNAELAESGMRFVPKTKDGGKDYSVIQEGDVCVLPAFGASIDEMLYLKKKNVQIVDASCPWVTKVWNTVEKTKEKGHTSIIHGKYNHEETVATKSFAATYIVVKTMDEAEYVANYMLGVGNREEFMEKFAHATSDGFDPDVDLDRVGVANQTTMLKGETEMIGRLFERVMLRKFGPQNLNEHFLSFNTICDATQERQDAMYKMLGAEYKAPASDLYAELEGEQVGLKLKSSARKSKLSSKQKEAETRGASVSDYSSPVQKPDLFIVVGGFNSSNTAHLIEIPEEFGVPAYHVDCAVRIGGSGSEVANVIQHKPLSTPVWEAIVDRGLAVTEGFLPDGPVTVGLTSGASTPDCSVGDCISRVLAIRGLST
eukprot:TRINITY_DN36550_c0_g1_i1.p1 TRINITY_DN36550_c0_g1~~TRINITY_DN36550_c0_g1_i1.p1  ORF type:complete len:605 (+),score=114.13 TRINITY_DN36550_c0_g1_i1:59-1816(+)